MYLCSSEGLLLLRKCLVQGLRVACLYSQEGRHTTISHFCIEHIFARQQRHNCGACAALSRCESLECFRQGAFRGRPTCAVMTPALCCRSLCSWPASSATAASWPISASRASASALRPKSAPP